MNRATPLLLILPIALVVLTSGCTGGGGSGTGFGNGIKIISWSPDFSTLSPEENVLLTLEVQNQGEKDAKNVKAVLAGLDLDLWDVSSREAEKDIGDLNPGTEDATTGTVTQPAIISKDFEATAPELPEGTEMTYNPIVRVYYTYATTAIKQIWLIPEAELRDQFYNQEALPSGKLDVTAGPLSVEVNMADVQKVVDRDPKFGMTVVIENIGGGTVGSDEGYSREQYEVDVSIELPDGLSFESDCRGFEGSGDTVKLRRGQKYDINCDVYVDEGAVDVRQQRDININLEYDYYIDAETQVEVLGMEE